MSFRSRLAAGLVALGTVVAIVLVVRGGDDRPHATRASPTPTATAAPTRSPAPTPTATPVPEWAMYGKDPSRRRFLDVDLRPPFKRRWRFEGSSLLEFPPVLRGNALWLMDYAGKLVSLDARTGKVRWKRDVAQMTASSPAVTEDRVIVTTLSRNDSYAGEVLAVRPGTGKQVWARDLPARTESSPLIADGNVYFGDESGRVYALKQSNGRELWSFQAGGAVKGGLAQAGRRVFVGTYGGGVYALDPRTGKLRWSASASGNLYSTPAVGAGRVVVGSVSGGIYAFKTRTGELAWSIGTGSYVYSSPAIARGPGGRPTAFIGSYNGSVYAIDVRTGAVRWTASAGGRVSGGISVIGRIAYVAELDGNTTSGFDTRTGRRVVTFPHGRYNPAISDGTALYLVGHSNVYKLVPKPRRGASGSPDRGRGESAERAHRRGRRSGRPRRR